MSRAMVESVVVGIAVFVLTAAVGSLAATSQPVEYSARATLYVQPAIPGDNADTLAGYYDTLSRGSVPATYVELLRASDPRGKVATRLGTDGEEPSAVEVAVVTDTSVIDVSASAGSADAAVAAADEAAAWATEFITGLGSPYGVRVIGSAAGTAVVSSVSAGVLLAAVVFAAGVVAVAVQQVLLLLLRRRSSVRDLDRARRRDVEEMTDTARFADFVLVSDELGPQDAEPALPAGGAPSVRSRA